MTEGVRAFGLGDDEELDAARSAARVYSLDDGDVVSPPTAYPTLARPAGADPAEAIPATSATQSAADAPPAVAETSGSRATPGWDEISPDRLRESANEETLAEGAASGMAWFEVVLGCLLGLAATIFTYRLTEEGSLGPYIVVPSLVLGLVLLAVPRNDVRHVGFGLLVSIPTAAVLGMGLWWVTQFL